MYDIAQFCQNSARRWIVLNEFPTEYEHKILTRLTLVLKKLQGYRSPSAWIDSETQNSLLSFNEVKFEKLKNQHIFL